ncbi:hypothetical protein SteCoe_23568 [Stentor coeruleus]|uniref:Uncharacterized protein n=1 Tax=Stentor coeruleus TaxID=5963 RepID=A0A1R2BJI7_9CILI|nr:hypothetical protein SteCoe_23568 [Stentor coeruleus]
MKIRHRKISSFLVQKRKDRLNKSVLSGDVLDLSINDSILDKSSSSIQYALTERSEVQSNADEYAPTIEKALENRCLTDRVNIPEENLNMNEVIEESPPVDAKKDNSFEKIQEDQNDYEEKKGMIKSSQSEKIFNVAKVLVTSGFIIGSLIYVIKNKRNFKG